MDGDVYFPVFFFDQCILSGLFYFNPPKPNRSFPSSYGFAVVENRQSNCLHLRMYLAEELVQRADNQKYEIV